MINWMTKDDHRSTNKALLFGHIKTGVLYKDGKENNYPECKE